MPAVVYIAKAATPEQLSWRRRIARNEKPLLAAFLAWVADLRAHIQESQIAAAVVSRATTAFDHVLQAVTFSPETLEPVIVEEASREFLEVARRLDANILVSFDVRNPNFLAAVEQQQAALVREVTAETRRAIVNAVARGYRDGRHPDLVAKEIHESIGLTSRQAQAVLNFAAAQQKNGVRPDVASDRAIRYARKLRAQRARTIARTETARGMVMARLQSYEQAAAGGLFDAATAEIEWSAVQDDPTEICAQLDGTRVPLGSTWPGGLLPGDAHPNCRCSPVLVLPHQDELTQRLQARIPEINRQLGIPAAAALHSR